MNYDRRCLFKRYENMDNITIANLSDQKIKSIDKNTFTGLLKLTTILLVSLILFKILFKLCLNLDINRMIINWNQLINICFLN
jgi:hypothetical protein